MLWSAVRRLLTTVVLCAAVAAAACGSSSSADSQGPAVLRTGAPGRVIPSGFAGISTELWAIPSFAGEDPNVLNPAFLQLVRNLAPGAQPVIRLGGDSTD